LTEENRNYIYGPVPSRRFGRSLGIDIVPFKICTYDCIYCQLGKTREKILNRKSFIDVNAFTEEFKTFMQKERLIDYVALSGSGEPTLNKDIGEIIKRIKINTDIPVLVLTNSSLLWNKEVRDDLKNADIIVPSMDAVSEGVFKKINRPVDGLIIDTVLEGLKKLSGEFEGLIFLEIMLVKGINDSEKEIELMKNVIKELHVDKIQLNTVIRPPSEKFSAPLGESELETIKDKLNVGIPIEIISQFSAAIREIYNIEIEKEVLNLLKRRPCKLDEMALSLGINKNELLKYLVELKNKKIVKWYQEKESTENYYVIV